MTLTERIEAARDEAVQSLLRAQTTLDLFSYENGVLRFDSDEEPTSGRLAELLESAADDAFAAWQHALRAAILQEAATANE